MAPNHHLIPIAPTYYGSLEETYDALQLVEAALSGHVNHIPRRPHDRERDLILVPGNVFIYEENASGIKRWTDGVSWSPSRIMGNFLVYREINPTMKPGEKKRAIKKDRASNHGGIGKSYSANLSGYHPHAAGNMSSASDMTTFKDANGKDIPISKELERYYVGSLTDSYDFKDGGLIKKTITCMYHGVPHHLVSYYTLQDMVEDKLVPPSRNPDFLGIRPRMELFQQPNFRAPLEGIAMTDGTVQVSIGHTVPQIYSSYHGPNPNQHSAFPGYRPENIFPVQGQLPPAQAIAGAADGLAPGAAYGYVAPQQYQQYNQQHQDPSQAQYQGQHQVPSQAQYQGQYQDPSQAQYHDGNWYY